MKFFSTGPSQRRQLFKAYGQQRVELDAEHAKRGIDVFVSPFDIARDKSGAEFSYCTWPEGLRPWLPKTDCIAFTGKHGDARWFFIVPWDDVEAICPSALEPIAGLAPVRMHARVWPNAEQVERLRATAIVDKG